MTLSLSLATFCRPNSFAFDFLQHHVHIRHRRDYDKQKAVVLRGGARGVPGGPLPPKNFAWPPSGPPKIFRVTSCHCIEVLHRPLASPLVAKLAPPVAPPK